MCELKCVSDNFELLFLSSRFIVCCWVGGIDQGYGML
jgi:hypothetical protein